jgi:hypothetical protein
MLIVWHSNIVYTNLTTGDTWVWKDRGPDKIFFDKKTGIEYWTITGRSVANVIGHIVVNNDTGDIEFVAGQQPFPGELLDFFAIDGYACDILGDD